MSVCGTVTINSHIEVFLVTRIVYVASTRRLQLLVIARIHPALKFQFYIEIEGGERFAGFT